MIQLTSELLAIRTRSIISYDREDIKNDSNYKYKNDEVFKKENNVLSIASLLKRLIVK